MCQDYITITLGLPELRVLKVEESQELIEVWVEKVTTHEACPDCGRFSNECHERRWMTCGISLSGIKVFCCGYTSEDSNASISAAGVGGNTNRLLNPMPVLARDSIAHIAWKGTFTA